MPEFFKVPGAECAIDDAVVAAHRNRHPVTDHNLVAIVDDRNFCDFTNGENKSLRRINDSGETVDAHAAEI